MCARVADSSSPFDALGDDLCIASFVKHHSRKCQMSELRVLVFGISRVDLPVLP